MKAKNIFLGPLLLISAIGAFLPAASFAQVDMDQVASEAAPAVVSVDGYKSFPVYTWQAVEMGPNTVKFTPVQSGSQMRRVTAGSGFFVTSDGYLVTNRHVVDDPSLTYRVNTGSQRVAATIVYKDPDYDLAILKISGQNFPALAIADERADIGQDVTSVGNALGRYVDSISSGKVVSLDETVVAEDNGGTERLDNLIATDAKLYPGDSGGPLLNDRGQAIGVNVAIAEDQDISFSIPGSIARSVLARAGI
jgi:S1-C subfamily serine protease